MTIAAMLVAGCGTAGANGVEPPTPADTPFPQPSSISSTTIQPLTIEPSHSTTVPAPNTTIERSEPAPAPSEVAGDPNVVEGMVVGWDHQPLSGVTVTINQGPGIYGPFTPVPDGAAILHPSNRTNPVETDDDGRFEWNVLAGWYDVTATKDGCVDAESDGLLEPRTGSFQQPSRNGYQWELVLDCRPNDDVDPVLTIISRPDEIISDTTAIVEFAISDDQGFVAAFCFSDLDTYEYHEAPDFVECTSPYEVEGFTDGDHAIGILVTDAQDNFVLQEIYFTVAT